MKIAKGLKDKNIVIGNNYDKYKSSNFLVKYIMENFHNRFLHLIKLTKAKKIFEIGCGEGYWINYLNNNNFNCIGADFSKIVIDQAKNNFPKYKNKFLVKSIYELDHTINADLIIVSEVLEHVDRYDLALSSLKKTNSKYILFTVPNEPLWCFLNILRFKYLLSFGNTPGHINHWNFFSFKKLMNKHFKLIHLSTTTPFIYALVENAK